MGTDETPMGQGTTDDSAELIFQVGSRVAGLEVFMALLSLSSLRLFLSVFHL